MKDTIWHNTRSGNIIHSISMWKHHKIRNPLITRNPLREGYADDAVFLKVDVFEGYNCAQGFFGIDSCLEVWPPRFQSLLIMGWCSSKPKHRLWLPLDSVPIFKNLCFPSEMILVPSFFPPPRFVRVPCSPEHLARLLFPFVLFPSSPSINAYSAAPLQCLVPPIVRPPSSVCRRATNPLAPADQFPLLVPRPIVP